MPLQQIVEQILTLSEHRASTPVLVTPNYLSLRKQFFVELTGELWRHTDRNVRIDWYRGLPGIRTMVSDQFAGWHAKSINRSLSRIATNHRTESGQKTEAAASSAIPVSHQPATQLPHAMIQLTATIARPGGKTRELVVGLSDIGQTLPDWTTAIWLGASQADLNKISAA